jgi:hypothetical protein
MAPHLAASQHLLIHDMILSRSLTDTQMAEVAGCSDRSIRAIRSNLRYFGTTSAPFNGIGRRRSITPLMLQTLCEYLVQNPELYQSEMVEFLWNEFKLRTTTSSICRALASIGWSKKTIRRTAKERNQDLRDFYFHQLSAFRSYQLVYIDESGCDTLIGFRRTGWSSSGVTPVRSAKFHRGRRWQILPAYTQEGVILSRVFQGPTDSWVFEDFIEQLLHHCGRWPEPRSVLIMDNASFHRTEKVKQLCSDAGVKLLYLPPYSPDLNPIEEYFAELKAFIKRNWKSYGNLPRKEFETYLNWCVDVVGARKRSAEGHFRHAGVTIEEI